MKEELAVEPVKNHKHKNGRKCHYVDYQVRRPEGQKINEILYHGKLNVPLCIADVLTELDQYWEAAETHLFSNKGGSRVVASLRE